MLLVPILLALMLFVAAPAVAQPANMVPVKVTGTALPGTGVPAAYFVKDGGILQLRDGVSGPAALKLYITSTTVPDYTLTDYGHEIFGVVNMGQEIPYPGPWPEAKGEWHTSLMWNYAINGQVVGTFEGEWKITSIGWYTTPVGHTGPTQGHAVLQGSGTFDGMTLILDSTGQPTTFTGYLLTH